MNYILVSFGSAGDVFPFIMVGKALKRKGHDVTFITSGYFKEKIQANGLNFYGVGSIEDYLFISTSPDLFHPTRGFAFVMKHIVIKNIEATYEAIAKLKKPNTVVISQSIAPGARVAHEKLGIPLITMNLQPVSFWSIEKPPHFSGMAIPATYPHWLKKFLLSTAEALIINRYFQPVNRLLKDLGLPKQKNIFSRWLYSPQKVIGLFPEWFAQPASDWPNNTVLTGFIGEEEMPELSAEVKFFLAEGPPPIVFTAGSAMHHAEEFFETASKVLQQMNKRGIFIGNADYLPYSKAILVSKFIPFQAVFPKAEMIVHHGGIGTIIPAIKAAKPQLIVPFSHDQPDNAIRVKNSGLGEILYPHKFTADNCIKMIKKLNADDQVKQTCKNYSDKIDLEFSMRTLLKEIENFDSVTHKKEYTGN